MLFEGLKKTDQEQEFVKMREFQSRCLDTVFMVFHKGQKTKVIYPVH